MKGHIKIWISSFSKNIRISGNNRANILTWRLLAGAVHQLLASNAKCVLRVTKDLAWSTDSFKLPIQPQ